MKSLGLTLRQRKILHTVLNRKDYITSAELAAALKVSSRTVRNDIGRLNHILGPYHAVITATQSKGVLLRTEEPEQLRELMNMDTAFFTREDRVRYLAFRLCLNDSPLNLYDLEDELFISHTALMTDIRSLREKYSKETLNKSPRTFGGKFCARLRSKNLEIHKVFLRFLRLGGHRICSPNAHVDLISASLILSRTFYCIQPGTKYGLRRTS